MDLDALNELVFSRCNTIQNGRSICDLPRDHKGDHKTELEIVREALAELIDAARTVLNHDPQERVENCDWHILHATIEEAGKHLRGRR